VIQALNFFTNLLSSDEHNIKYLLLQKNIFSFLEQIMHFNSTSPTYDDQLEYKLHGAFNNLLHSSTFEYGLCLLTGNNSWIMDRLVGRIQHCEYKYRRESYMTVAIVMMNHNEEVKNLFVQKYDLIRGLLEVSTVENHAKNLMPLINALEITFVRRYVSRDDLESEEIDYQNVNVPCLENFFSNDGIEVLISIKEKVKNVNTDLYYLISRIEQKYFLIETSEVAMYQQQ